MLGRWTLALFSLLHGVPFLAQLVIAAPVVYEYNWVAVHGWSVPAATADVFFLGNKPHATFATHSLRAMKPWIADGLVAHGVVRVDGGGHGLRHRGSTPGRGG